MAPIIETIADDLLIRDFVPDDTRAIIDGQLELYAREYDLTTDVWQNYLVHAVEEFAERFDPARDCMIVAELAGKVQGAAAITHIDDETAQFRFFYLDESLRGKGMGRKMFAYTVDFCREKNYRRIFLWTFSTLYAARALYKEQGFAITEEKENREWGPPLVEERWDRVL